MSVAIERIWEMPSVNTFEMPKLRDWIMKWCTGKVLNAFGGKTKLNKYYNGTIIHNDLNLEIEADTHHDALFLDKHFPEQSFNTVILDPPYSMHQAVHYYNGYKCKNITKVRNSVDKILCNGGIVISLGWNTTGMSLKRGYKKLAICCVSSGGSHNDILIVVERKMKGVIPE